MDDSLKLLIMERLDRWDSLSDSEQILIKNLILPTILSGSPHQFSEALANIGSYLLPGLITCLDNALVPDLTHVNKILATLNLLFKKFRCKWTSELLIEHMYCLDHFVTPLMKVFKIIRLWNNSVGNGSAATATLRLLVEAQRLCCRIFYSLNFHHLHDYFDESKDTWFTEFQMYMCGDYSALEDLGGDDLKLVEEMRAAVCENISLYMEKECDAFGAYLWSKDTESRFVRTVLRRVVSMTPSCERLMLAGIKFLTIASLNPFFDDNGLVEIIQEIPTRYVMLRDEDEHIFQENDAEFLRRDIEGHGLDARRRIACELLKGIGKRNKETVTMKVSKLIYDYLCQFDENNAGKWKHMDCAIYLLISLGIENASCCLVDAQLMKISFSVVKATLRYANINKLPMLEASALKYFTACMNIIPKPEGTMLISEVISSLESESNVVHSYAGSCIEKLLLVKNDGGQAIYTSIDIAPYVVLLSTNLLNALKKKGSEENQYIMKCIMRLLGVADISFGNVYSMMAGLNSILNKVCENPKSPIFNYYLFESLSLLLRRGHENNIDLSQMYDFYIFPNLQKIFTEDLSDFFPYAFQLSAQLKFGHLFLSEYMHKFDTFLLSSSIAPSAQWLQSLIKNVPHEINKEERLPKVLSLLKSLLASPSTYDQGFYVLNAVIANYDHAVFVNHMSPIWVTIFAGFGEQVLTSRFAKCVVIFLSLFLVKHGLQKLFESVVAAKNDVFLNLLEHIWIPYVKLVTGPINIKLTSVASTQLFSDLPYLTGKGELWVRLLENIVTLLKTQERVVGAIPFEETVCYSVNSVYLYNASTKEDDPLKEITDLKHFLVKTLATSEIARKIIWDNVSYKTRRELAEMCILYCQEDLKNLVLPSSHST